MKIKILIIVSLLSTFSFAFNTLYTKAFIAYKKGIRYYKTDIAKADLYFKEAYTYLMKIKTPSSQKDYLIGKMYFNGWGVKKDLYKAKKFFSEALKFGNQRVYCDLAKLYLELGNKRKAKQYIQNALMYNIQCKIDATKLQ